MTEHQTEKILDSLQKEHLVKEFNDLTDKNKAAFDIIADKEKQIESKDKEAEDAKKDKEIMENEKNQESLMMKSALLSVPDKFSKIRAMLLTAGVPPDDVKAAEKQF